jgi:deazaflavin-dependent oxidoreductase (nitroreductase family)
MSVRERRKRAGAADPFKDALRRRDEIAITTVGRRTGRPRTVPVWFVLDRRALWLLPTEGSRNHWFRNLQADPIVRVRAGRYRRIFRARLYRGRATARRTAGRFGRKYGRGDVAAYYSRFDAAVRISLQ